MFELILISKATLIIISVFLVVRSLTVFLYTSGLLNFLFLIVNNYFGIFPEVSFLSFLDYYTNYFLIVLTIFLGLNFFVRHFNVAFSYLVNSLIFPGIAILFLLSTYYESARASLIPLILNPYSNPWILFMIGQSIIGVSFTKLVDIGGDYYYKIRRLEKPTNNIWDSLDGFGDLVGDATMKITIFSLVFCGVANRYFFLLDALNTNRLTIELPSFLDVLICKTRFLWIVAIAPLVITGIFEIIFSRRNRVDYNSAIVQQIFFFNIGWIIFVTFDFGREYYVCSTLFLTLLLMLQPYYDYYLMIDFRAYILGVMVFARTALWIFITGFFSFVLITDNSYPIELERYMGVLVACILLAGFDFAFTTMDILTTVHAGDEHFENAFDVADNFGNGFKNTTRIVLLFFMSTFTNRGFLNDALNFMNIFGTLLTLTVFFAISLFIIIWLLNSRTEPTSINTFILTVMAFLGVSSFSFFYQKISPGIFLPALVGTFGAVADNMKKACEFVRKTNRNIDDEERDFLTSVTRKCVEADLLGDFLKDVLAPLLIIFYIQFNPLI